MTEISKLIEEQFKECIDSLDITLYGSEYGLQLSSFEKLKMGNLPYIFNVEHLANFTEISSKQVQLFILDKRKAYSSFRLTKKSGGFRTIDAPSKKMKKIQRWILDNILYNIDPGEYAHGFLPKKSITTNSSLHVGQDLVLGIDIKDFFPSITLNRVKGLFRSFGYNDEISNSLAEICTFNWRLPQGAPTSPMISNLIAKRLDVKLAQFCKRKKLNYSRYADDITISGGKNLPKFKKMIFDIIERQNFKINFDKVRLHDRGSSQRVTGLVVNDKISIGRKRRKWLRAIVHNILKNGPVIENRNNNPFFKEWLFGNLGHAKMVNPDFANPLIESLLKIDWDEYYERLGVLKESEINRRSLKRQKNFIEIPFNDLGCFKNIDEIPQKWPDELRVQLDKLLEKCPNHSTDECKDCLNKQDEIYEICMKYILGHYIGNTGGHHHGHEVYDIACSTDLYNDAVFVAFLAKSGKMTGVSNNSIFRQTHACTKDEEIDVISIVTTNDLDHKLLLDLKDIIRKSGKEHKYCLIMRNEMARIVQTFNSANI